ncbi:MAG: hypothetical protein JW798_16145 [Prolixibacteraceae bacterium]|nr:hypothetical protein [Prolixibacteraceae bacterium]
MKYFYLFILLFAIIKLFGQEHFSSIYGQNFRVKIMGESPVTVVFENGMKQNLKRNTGKSGTNSSQT